MFQSRMLREEKSSRHAKLSSPRRFLSRQDCHASWHILHGYRRQAKIRPEICHREDTRNCRAFVTGNIPSWSSLQNNSRYIRGNNIKYDAINRLCRNYSNQSCVEARWYQDQGRNNNCELSRTWSGVGLRSRIPRAT